jgi:hypothetical protein
MAAKTMIDGVDERLGLDPERLACEAGLRAAEMLDWLVPSAASSRTCRSSVD